MFKDEVAVKILPGEYREEVERLGPPLIFFDLEAMAGLASMANDRPPVMILPVIPGGDIESGTEDERDKNDGRP